MSESKIGLVPGLHLQLYIDAFQPRSPRDGISDVVNLAKSDASSVVKGIICHDFPKDRGIRGFDRKLVNRAAQMDALVSGTDNRLQFSISFGLDGSSDSDGTRLTAKEKGERMALASNAARGCTVVADAEGQWDDDKGVEDDMDEAGALAMCQAFFEKAPESVLVDQPWPMIDQHGENRRSPKPIGEGGSFAGFPVDEFAKYVSASFRQFYWANWYRQHGERAYSVILDWMNREWAKIDAAMTKLDPSLVKPRFVSIQGYGHDLYPWTVVRCLVEREEEPVIVWCDPAPTTGFWAIIRVMQFLHEEKDRKNLCSLRDLVKEIQAEAGLVSDGIVGRKTWPAIAMLYQRKTGRKAMP